MTKPSVFVVDNDPAYQRMFLRNGWGVVNDAQDADLIQFTGGHDVDPMLYGEPKHPSTHSNPQRDSREADLFNRYSGEKPMAGICRGGQFLCVMNGGRMWQDVNNHATGGIHYVTDLKTGEQIEVSSTHHQMMDPSPAEDYTILATASLCTQKKDGWGNNIKVSSYKSDPDIEAVYFDYTDCLSFQPHPEFFDETHECQVLYFKYIEDYLGLKA